GTCLHVGCIPTKALLYGADVMDTFRNAKELGFDVSSVAVNWAQMQARKNKIVAKPADGTTRRVRAKNIMIATGSTARLLPGMAADDRILTNIEILALDQIPKKLVIIGAGAVGIEFASIYRRFDTEVTVLEMLPRI